MGSKRPYELNVPQVAGAVLATVTGAAVASWFGVAGTLIGAGVLSLASTVGSAIYTHHLSRTAERLDGVRARMARRRPKNEGMGPEGDTVEIDRSRIKGAAQEKAAAQESASGDTVKNAGENAARRSRPRWLVVGGLAVAVFAATMLLIFGLEALMGGSMSSVLHGRPDGGTTLFQTRSADTPLPGDTTGTPAPEETAREDGERTREPESPDPAPTEPEPTYPEPTEPVPTEQPTEQEPPEQRQDQPDQDYQPEPRNQPSGSGQE